MNLKFYIRSAVDSKEGLTAFFFFATLHLMLKLRLMRVGRKHDPSFRVVVTESTKPVHGKYMEAVGFYSSRLKQLQLNAERIKYWLEHGAIPTDVTHNLFVREGIIKGEKRLVHSTKKKSKDTDVAEKPAAEAQSKPVEAELEAKTEETPAPAESIKEVSENNENETGAESIPQDKEEVAGEKPDEQPAEESKSEENQAESVDSEDKKE